MVGHVALFFSLHGLLSTDVKVLVSFTDKIYLLYVTDLILLIIEDLIELEAIKLHKIQVS